MLNSFNLIFGRTRTNLLQSEFLSWCLLFFNDSFLMLSFEPCSFGPQSYLNAYDRLIKFVTESIRKAPVVSVTPTGGLRVGVAAVGGHFCSPLSQQGSTSGHLNL